MDVVYLDDEDDEDDKDDEDQDEKMRLRIGLQVLP